MSEERRERILYYSFAAGVGILLLLCVVGFRVDPGVWWGFLAGECPPRQDGRSGQGERETGDGQCTHSARCLRWCFVAVGQEEVRCRAGYAAIRPGAARRNVRTARRLLGHRHRRPDPSPKVSVGRRAGGIPRGAA